MGPSTFNAPAAAPRCRTPPRRALCRSLSCAAVSRSAESTRRREGGARSTRIAAAVSIVAARLRTRRAQTRAQTHALRRRTANGKPQGAVSRPRLPRSWGMQGWRTRAMVGRELLLVLGMVCSVRGAKVYVLAIHSIMEYCSGEDHGRRQVCASEGCWLLPSASD